MQQSPPLGWRTRAEAEAVLSPLLELPEVHALLSVAGARTFHIVGGTVRDRLLGRAHRDLDVVVGGDGARLARRLAAALGARLVPLGHDGLVSYRVARPDLVLDLWDRSGAPLEADLARRDLTINALAFAVPAGRLTDPLGGLEDLRRGRLRVPSPAVLDDDPLRVLRIARLASELGFRPTPDTVEAARARSARLPSVAAERVRHELEVALAIVPGTPCFELLCELGVHPGVVPGEPVLERADRDAFERSDALVQETPWLLPPAVAPLPLHWRLLLGALPQSSIDRALRRLARRGYLGRETARQCAAIARGTGLPDGVPDRRWFLHEHGALWPTAAVARASLDTRRPLSACRRVLAELEQLATAEAASLFDPPPLVATREVMEICGLRPGPALGRVLADLRRRQVEGELTTPDDARRWLESSTPRS
ncbi:MAG: hypothetical protein R2991_05675 [Thermoanaerobaculia bacterium]